MPFEVLILIFGVIVSIGGFILAGQWIQAKHSEGGGGGRETKRLGESLDSVREELRTLQDEVSGLSERLEFTERLLAPPDADEDRLSSSGRPSADPR